MRKFRTILLIALVTAAAIPAGSTVATGGEHHHGHHRLPSTIDLPDGFFPEGIASGHGSTFYVGSLADGTIYRGDYRTGAGEVLTEPAGSFATVGLNVDRWGRVWAAGGPTGVGRVYDGATGELLASFEFAAPFESFINDVIVTKQAAWFTDSGTQNSPDPANFQFAGEPRVFKVPLGTWGRLPGAGAVEELPVGMPDIAFPNLNGIETTPDGRALVVAHNVQGTLYRVDPRTGDAAVVDIDHSFAGPDGLVRQGRKLYVVEPGAARVATVRLDRRGTSGEIQRLVTVPGAETPTTAALFGRGVYVVDARFTSMTGPYQVTRLPLACRRVDTTGRGQGAASLPGDPPDLVRTEATIDSGLLRGTTEAAFTITGGTPTGFAFAGELTFTTRRGTLTLDLAGTLDVSTGEFASSGPVRSGTDRFDGAVGTITLDGVQDLADPAGSFTEQVTGEVCFDRGHRW
ncbi:SMP-30/gluconolactonase/LRE family protein [Ilumatobacter sp.]|uniref:SMP-30/gluconolactonase/LRE family protein n=1 Tax=Ilumatobacter sp. TaxID=1967498 RepID=UPI003AF799A3